MNILLTNPKLDSKIQKWILRFFTKHVNPRSLGLRCVQETELKNPSVALSRFFGSFDAP